MSGVTSGKAAAGVLLAAAMAGLLAGCPPRGAICPEGTTVCGNACRDLASDGANCGACGGACGDKQVCQAGACTCQGGATSCGGQCVTTDSDPSHCGGCAGAGGTACSAGQVCEAGVCKVACSLAGYVRCGDSCVNPLADVNHCGGCGKACPDNQSCHGGVCTYDVIAACQSNGQVVGLQVQTDFVGPATPGAPSVESLATLGDVLLQGDGYVDRKMYQAKLSGQLGLVPVTSGIGNDARQILVEDPFVYVVNASTNTLQVLRRRGAVGDLESGRAEGGFPLDTVAEHNFGQNTNPQAMVKLGTRAFVPLFGTTGAAGIAAGQKVAMLDLQDPTHPTHVRDIYLGELDLKPFFGASVARPSWIVSHQGQLYVPLNNLEPQYYTPNGPGMLAKINPETYQVTAIDLGSDVCVNAGFAASAGEAGLVVGCGGQSDYSNWPVVTTQKTGVVLVKGDRRVAAWSAACPEGATCASPAVLRLLVVGSRIYVGDQAAGRVFVLEIVGDSLVERRGYSTGSPIAVCAVGSLGYSNVADLYAP